MRFKNDRQRKAVMAKIKNINDRARLMIGDGKTPNKYFVSLTNDMEALKGNEIISTDDYKGAKRFISKIDGEYDNYIKARREASEKLGAIEDFGEIKAPVTQVIIEDRLSGEVYRETEKGSKIEDIGFSRETEKKRKVKPTYDKSISKNINKSNVVDYMMAYEDGTATDKDILKLFSYIGKNKMQYSLQGMYGRTLSSFVSDGWLNKDFSINQKKVKENEI